MAPAIIVVLALTCVFLLMAGAVAVHQWLLAQARIAELECLNLVLQEERDTYFDLCRTFVTPPVRRIHAITQAAARFN